MAWDMLPYTLGDLGSARSLLEECLEIERELGDNQAIAKALTGLGQSKTARATTRQRVLYFRKAWTLRGELGDVRGVAWSLVNLAIAVYGLGRNHIRLFTASGEPAV